VPSDGVSDQDLLPLEEALGSLGISEIPGLKPLEEENRKLKQLVADLSLDKLMLYHTRVPIVSH
jgi:putative transposase